VKVLDLLLWEEVLEEEVFLEEEVSQVVEDSQEAVGHLEVGSTKIWTNYNH
jgi:hypothetical protein